MAPPERSRRAPSRGPARRLLDRLLTRTADLALRAFFRDTQVLGRDRIPTGRPLLVVANHFNGFVDPVMLVKVFDRLPRFLAKATYWHRPGFPILCRIAGMIPIHRPEDGVGASDNSDVFRTCNEVLVGGDTVSLFPEGRTHDLSSIQEVRTGAARIALGAHAAGAHDLVVLPVGLTYDNKLVLRTRALAHVGEPIEVGAWVEASVQPGAAADASNHEAVTALTNRIREGLREVSPNYATTHQARALGRVGEIVARTGHQPGRTYVSLGAQEAIARPLGDAPEEVREEIIDALGRYQLDLDLLGFRDHQLVPGYRGLGLARRTVTTTMVLALLALPALVGLVWNAPPYLLVRLAGNRVTRPVLKGTVRLSVALVVFPLAWLIVVWTDPWEGFLPGLAVFLAAPLLGLIAVNAMEATVRGVRAWRGWMGLRARAGMVEEVLGSRARVVEAVDRAGSPKGPTTRQG